MLLLLTILLLVVPNAEGILFLTGVSTMEDLDESTVERFESLRTHPLPLNSCGRSRLLSSGLLSRYQIASLLDYRSRCGDILSFTELAAVDGFGPDYATALKEFISLEPSHSKAGKDRLRQTLMLRTYAKFPEGEDVGLCAGVKYRAEYAGLIELDISDRTTYSSPKPSWGTASLSLYGRRYPGKVIAGDYNARFGQGLLVWTGTTMSGVSSARALSRNGSGISPSRSFSPTLHGVAADYCAGRWMVSAGFDRRMMGLANVSYTGRTWQAGLTGITSRERSALSADCRIGFAGGAVFGEVALENRAVAGVAGAFWIPVYGSMLSALVRAYPPAFPGTTAGAIRSSSKVSDEYGLSLAAQNPWGLVTLDASVHPEKSTQYYKVLTQVKKNYMLGSFEMTSSLRASERCSVPSGGKSLQWRGDFRTDVGLKAGGWNCALRFNAVHSKDWGLLAYGEAGWKGAIGEMPLELSTYARSEWFRADNWDDRIYVYERDAPGSFNVPAYYGRGWNHSLFLGMKYRCHSLYLRASWRGRELRLQYQLAL